MATEVFTNYTEVDANNKLTVTSSRATGANVGRDEEVYLYKDFGPNYFNNLYVTFELYVASTSVYAIDPNIAAVGGMGFANVVDDVSGFSATDINVMIGTEPINAFKLWLVRGPGAASDVYIGAADTIYYCLLERAVDSDTVTLKIYSDAARTTLLDTLTISGVGVTTQWRYCYGFVNWDGGYAGTEFDGYVQNLNIVLPNIYLMNLKGLKIPYEDKDESKELHVLLKNLSPTSKEAGAAGEVVIEIKYELAA